jgi:phage tail sheath protein FI
VYVEEVPSGVRTITGVATSVTAFVGRALRGPTDTPVTVTSMGEFERRFGGLWTGSALGFAVRDFFANGGGQAVIVRLYCVAGGEALPAVTSDAGTDVFTSTAHGLQIGDAIMFTALTGGAGLAPNKPYYVATVPNANTFTLAAVKGGASVDHTSNITAATTVKVRPARATLSVGTSPNKITLEAAEEGAWGNDLRLRVDHDTREPDTTLGETTTSLFNLFVRDGGSGVVEEHRNLVVAPADHPRQVSKVLENESRLVRTSSIGTGRPDPTGTTVDAGKTIWDDNTSPTNVAVASAAQASDGQALTQAQFTGPGLEGAKKGLYALQKADLVNLLVIPPYKSDQSVDAGVVTAAATYAESRRAILLVDPLPGWDEPSDVTGAFASGFDATVGTVSRNAALYFPRLRQPNPLKGNQVESFAPSGAVAGVLARTDAQRGVWKAPAGLDATLTGIPAVSVPLTDGEVGLLNPLGVNCLRAVPGAGRVVWGARTLQGADRLASEWKYLPVRRTALFIEESLYRGTQWVVFEPNDEPLWAQIRLNVGTFMTNLFRQGAFQGRTPREAFFVRCDRETTTQADIDLGIVNIHVGFAPLKPAEFVVIRLQQMAGQAAAS